MFISGTRSNPRMNGAILERLDSSTASRIRSRMFIIQNHLSRIGKESGPNWPLVAYHLRLMVEDWLKAAQKDESLNIPKEKLYEMFTTAMTGPYEVPVRGLVKAAKSRLRLDGRKKKRKKVQDASVRGSGGPGSKEYQSNAGYGKASELAEILVIEALNGSILGHSVSKKFNTCNIDSSGRKEFLPRFRESSGSAEENWYDATASREDPGFRMQFQRGCDRHSYTRSRGGIREKQTIECLGAK